MKIFLVYLYFNKFNYFFSKIFKNKFYFDIINYVYYYFYKDIEIRV